MSNDNKSTENPIIVIDVEESETVEKKSIIKKGVNFIKTHKKATIAVVGLGALVGAAALLGRGTETSPAFESDDSDLTPQELGDYEVEDTTVA